MHARRVCEPPLREVQALQRLLRVRVSRALGFGFEDHNSEGRQCDREGVRMTVGFGVGRFDAALVTAVGSSVDVGVGVEDL